MNFFSVRRMLAAAATLSLAVSAQATDISGAGATFPYPVYSKWADAYKTQTGVGLNYQSIGSGGGIKQIKAKTVTFGASDKPLEPTELKESGLVQFPMIIGGVVPVVNIKGVKGGQVTLDGATVAAVMGRVHQYGDRRLPIPGAIGILAAVITTVARIISGSPAGVITAGIALLATLAWLGLYLRVAAPVNRALTAAAIAHVTPANSRSLQSRWDSIIAPRALLMAVAVAGLATSAAIY